MVEEPVKSAGSEKMQRVALRMPPRLRRVTVRAARREKVSFSSLVRRAVETYLTQQHESKSAL
jgi:predicted HicB family RNase H-like nuclease